ncbi:hypothetical protein BN13_470023 [Nostocoides jenkinsii Ben 74]|uniref:Uncharacterized protein n=1 Tax=Nostocoides jenkinsii Ben 74 TaxID=1193518 RepID=A0A077MF55_9MICO|nr:hypothetical protein BN13_470023 [Tetrasphaera jenkinsii Ben 74]
MNERKPDSVWATSNVTGPDVAIELPRALLSWTTSAASGAPRLVLVTVHVPGSIFVPTPSPMRHERAQGGAETSFSGAKTGFGGICRCMSTPTFPAPRSYGTGFGGGWGGFQPVVVGFCGVWLGWCAGFWWG